MDKKAQGSVSVIFGISSILCFLSALSFLYAKRTFQSSPTIAWLEIIAAIVLLIFGLLGFYIIRK